MNEPYTSYERGWIIHIRPARQTPPSRIVVLIHGWTGDERSMDIFTRGLHQETLLLSPRGPVEASAGGYGWSERREGESLASYLDLVPTAQRLLIELDLRLADFGLQHPPLSLAGFSQGAAISYVLAFLFPDRIQRMAALAGFLPDLPAHFKPQALVGKPFFIAHGIHDETVPVERAHSAVIYLQACGAQVEYCESSSGHKLALPCFHRLTTFLNA